MIDQDKAARSAGEGAKEAEREQVKLGLRRGRKAGPLRRGDSGLGLGLVLALANVFLTGTLASGVKPCMAVL